MTRVQYCINVDICSSVSGWLGKIVDIYSDGITLGIDKGMKIDSSNKYFECFDDSNLQGLVIGVQDSISSGVC